MLAPSQMFLNNLPNALFACPGHKAYLRFLLTPSRCPLNYLISLVSNKATWSQPSPQSGNNRVPPLLRDRRSKQLCTSGNSDIPFTQGAVNCFTGKLTFLKQNSGLCQIAHLAVRLRTICPSQLEAPSCSSSPPHTGTPAVSPAPPLPTPPLTSSSFSGREPRSIVQGGFSAHHFTSKKYSLAWKKRLEDKIATLIISCWDDHPPR